MVIMPVKVEVTDGKVYFRTTAAPDQLLQLRTVERLFIGLCKERTCWWWFKPGCHGWRKQLEKIQTWQECAALWRQFQNVELSSFQKNKPCSHKEDVLMVSQNGHSPDHTISECSSQNKNCHALKTARSLMGDNPSQPASGETASPVQFSVTHQRSAETNTAKCEMNPNRNIDIEGSCKKAPCAENTDKPPLEPEKMAELGTGSSPVHLTDSAQEPSDSSKLDTGGSTAELSTHCNSARETDDLHVVTTCVNNLKSSKCQRVCICNNHGVCLKRKNLETVESTKRLKQDVCQSSDTVTFRVSCKCTGRLSRSANVQEVVRCTGVFLTRNFGWKVDLKDPQIEVCVHINDHRVTIGIPVTKQPLSKRNYIQHIGLRSPVAFIMAQSACIQPGAVVLDPMCGAGTLLLETAASFTCTCIGVDRDSAQLSKAADNISYGSFRKNISLIKGDVTALPLKTSSVDVVLCDMPFGENHGTVRELSVDYPEFIRSMDRVLKPGGRCVLLTGRALKDVLLKATTGLTVDHHEKLQKSYTTVETSHTTTEHIRTEDGNLTATGDDVTLEKAAVSIQDEASRCGQMTHKSDIVSQLQNQQENKRGWTSTLIHYLKLGDTHAYMCVFKKNENQIT